MGKRQEIAIGIALQTQVLKACPFTINCIATTSNAPTMKIWRAHSPSPSSWSANTGRMARNFTTTPTN